MPDTLRSPRHKALIKFVKEQRQRAGLTQAALAKKIGRYQSYVADLERGQRRIDVVEYLTLADALGFDPHAGLRKAVRSKG